MFKEIKRLSTSSAAYGIGNFIERLLSFVLLPLYTHLLNIDELGLNFTIFVSIGFLNVIYAYGLDTAFLRNYILAGTSEKKKVLFSTSTISIIITSVIFSSLLIIFSGEISLLLEEEYTSPLLIKLASTILLFDVMSNFGFLVLRAEEKAARFVSLKIVKTGLILVLNVVFVAGFKFGVMGILLANAIASVVSLITVLPVYYNKFVIAFNKSDYKDLLKFGLPYIFPGISIIVMELIDRYFLLYYRDMETVGIYGASYKIAMIMALLVAAFRFSWHPFFLSIKDQADSKEIYARILTYFFIISTGVFLFVSFFMNEILNVVPVFSSRNVDKYKEGLVVLPYVLAGHMFNGAYVNFIVGIFLKKKSHYLPFIVGSSAVVNVVGNYFLVPEYGILGAAVTTTISYFIMAAIMYVVSLKIYPIKYEWGRIIKLFLITAVIFFLPYFINIDNRFPAELIAFFSFPVLLYVSGFFRREELRKAKSVIFRK